MSKQAVCITSQLFMSFALTVSSCGPQASSTGSKPQPGQTGDESPNDSSSGFVELSSVDAKIYLGNQLSTLRALTKSNGKKLSVFQFSGVLCESCKEDSPGVQEKLSALKDVARYVIFPNLKDEFSTADYTNFVSSYAKNASYVVDHEQSVLKTVRLRKNDVTQFFGIYLLVKPDGKVLIMNKPDAFTQVVSVVKDSLK